MATTTTAGKPFSLIITFCFFFGFLVNVSSTVANSTPLPPIINLVSFTATALSNTNNATWNITISVSNPNPKSTIKFDDFGVGLFYNNHSEFGPNAVFVGVGVLGSFVQPVLGYNTFSLSVSFSILDLGGKEVVERFLKDQNSNGTVGVSVIGSYHDTENKIRIVYADVVVAFKKPGGKNPELGFVPGLPKALDFIEIHY